MAAGQNWTEDELVLALYLYFYLPTKKHDDATPEVIKLARLLGRTLASVSTKLMNLKRYDHRATGVGLKNGGKKDKEIWDLFYNKPEELCERKDAILTTFYSDSTLFLTDSAPIYNAEDDNLLSYFQDDKIVAQKYRERQNLFRGVLLKNYHEQCCLSHVGNLDFLVASHIVPWRENKDIRLDPQNGLILNVFLDKAFDKGYITIDSSDFRVRIAPEKIFARNCSGTDSDKEIVREQLLLYENQQIFLPYEQTRRPRREYLEYHNDKIFLG